MLNCPACGASAPVNLKFTKLMVCEHCKTTLFIEDEAVKHAGKKAALIDTPSIFSIGRRYRYRTMYFEPMGRIQFEYGDGTGVWDEWWVMDDSGTGKWISIDEGDIAIETPVEHTEELPECILLKPGQELKLLGQTLTVTEVNKASCLSVEGRLPEVIFAGEKHQYAHCSAPGGILFTIECSEDTRQLYKGSWIDPFDIEQL